MNLDIRLPMGLMFTLVGAIIAGFGLWTSSNAQMYEKSLNHNINLIWGLVMFAFGLAMLGLAWRASKATPVAQVAKPEDWSRARALGIDWMGHERQEMTS